MLSPHLHFQNYQGRRLHLGVTGSIAAYKALDLLRAWNACGVSVTTTLTTGAQRFLSPLSFKALGAQLVLTDMFDSSHSDFPHLYPAQHSHAFVIAPATANILSKLVHGLADDLLSCQALAFPHQIVLAPCMNHNMWNAPITQENWSTLQKRGCFCVDPISGPLACGETGEGRLAPFESIFLAGLKSLSQQDMVGTRVLITLGPTREFFDPVRFISNPSSGLMGSALAVAAWLRGAEVVVVRGPSSFWLPPQIVTHDCCTAQEMLTICLELWPECSTACLCAAVSDFTPLQVQTKKMKKSSYGLSPLKFEFELTPDILATLGQHKKSSQKLIGFAAETDSLQENVRNKLLNKNCDLILGNPVLSPDSGFGTPTNQIYALDRHGRQESWPLLQKTEVAWRIWDWTLQLN